MHHDKWDKIINGFFILMVIAILLAMPFTAFVLPQWECDSKYGSFEHKWDLISGCLIQDINGNWIPDENWRVID